MSIPTTIQNNQRSTTNPNHFSQASATPNHGARPKIRTTVPTFSLHHSELESATAESCAASSGSYQDDGGDFAVFTKKKHRITHLTTSGASPKTTQHPQYSFSAQNSHRSQKSTQNNTPTAPRAAHRTSQLTSRQFADQNPQSNLKTNATVNNFMTQVNKLHYLSRKDINQQTTKSFHKLNQDVAYLTDDHRKKLLTIIPEISEIIDRKDLDGASIVTILLSLAKTKFCNKLNSNSTSKNECIKHEQACKNLIAKILDKIQTHEEYESRHWSTMFHSLKLIGEQAPYLVDKETINNLVIKFNIAKQDLTGFNALSISNMFLSLHKLIKINKLDHRLPDTYSSLEYLLQQIKPVAQDFVPQSIEHILFAAAKLSRYPEFINLITDNQNAIILLLKEIIKDKHPKWQGIEVSLTIYGIANLIYGHTCISDELKSLAGEAYNVLYPKIPSIALNNTAQSSNHLLSGVIKLIRMNKITYNKPSKDLVRDIFLNKIIANPSLIDNNELYDYLFTIAFYRRYLTSDDIIKIGKRINFFIPEVSYLKTYFTSMGCFLVKIRDEIAKDKTNKELLALEKKFTTEIKKTLHSFRFKLKSISLETRIAINNTCSLIDGITDLALLPASYPDASGSQLEDECLDIIKTLIPNPESLKRECNIDNLPPIDACITYPDGSMLAIEIQGPGHYVDDNGEHPTGKHLFKMAQLKKANIKVLEINAYKLMSHNNPRKTAEHLINLLAEHNIKIRPEYHYNIPKLLRDAGFFRNDNLQTI